MHNPDAKGGRLNMITALTVWENLISPVFDSSHTLLVAEIENKEITNRHYEPFDPSLPSLFAGRLKSLGVEVLICGAISQLPSDIIEAIGIKLLPFISGHTDEVLENLVKDKSIVPEFLMPGCGFRNNKNYCKGKKQFRHYQKKGVNHMPRGDGTGSKSKGLGKGKGPGRCKSGQGSQGSGKKPGQGKRQGQGAGTLQAGNKGRGPES
jgi:predicted Fe-Mo cluster-binding NifX family protein